MSGRRLRALLVLALPAVPACGTGAGGDIHDLGDTAVVEYSQAASDGSPGKSTMLAVTVLRVRQGTQDELKQGGLEVDPEDRTATPYYVDARFENQGQTAVKRNLDVSLEDPDGNSLPTTLIFGIGGEPYKPCVNVSEGTLAPGQSYESCTLVLVPEGEEVDKALFVSQQADAEIVFNYWKVD